MKTLQMYGWTHHDQTSWDSLGLHSLKPARVIADFGTSLTIAYPETATAELTGKLAHHTNREVSPKVGDWVAARILDDSSAVIESVVCRRNAIARKVVGKRTSKQIIAANVDVAFVLLALDNDFSIERLQRFLFQLVRENISPVIVLNKADKTNDVPSYLEQLRTIEHPIVVTTAVEGVGIDKVLEFIAPGRTAMLLGSSGVGKSTLTNRLLQRDEQATQAVRTSDATGKHTTVHRELFVLPNGGLLIDNPGVREFALWGIEDDVDLLYADIVALSRLCRFDDCRHEKESGCAIKKALQNGLLDKNHYANYCKMRSELVGLNKRTVVARAKANQRPPRNSNWNDEEWYG